MLLQCKTVALAQFNIFKQERLGTWSSAWIIPVSTVAQLMLTTLLWLFLSANPQWPSHCRVTPQLNFWRRRSVPVGHFLNLLTSLLSSPLCGHGNISRLIYFLSLTACNVCDADITGHYNAKAGSKLIGGGGCVKAACHQHCLLASPASQRADRLGNRCSFSPPRSSNRWFNTSTPCYWLLLWAPGLLGTCKYCTECARKQRRRMHIRLYILGEKWSFIDSQG